MRLRDCPCETPCEMLDVSLDPCKSGMMKRWTSEASSQARKFSLDFSQQRQPRLPYPSSKSQGQRQVRLT